MTQDLNSFLKYGNRFYSVEQTQVNGENKYYGIVLKKKKKLLDIERSFETSDFKTLKTNIPKGKPIILVINTDSVLTKKIQGKTYDASKLAHLAFPNIKIEDFYFESVSQDTNHFVSICRKSYVDELLKDYASKQITVIDFTLGSLICSSILGFVANDEINTSNSLISIQNSQIADISLVREAKETTYNINGLDIKNNNVLGFAAVINLVLKGEQIQTNFSATKTQLNEAFKQKQFTSQFLKIGLSSLFIILLLNFLFFNHYYNEVNALRETEQILESSKANMVSLNEKVQKMEKMVDDVLKSNASKSSFFVDVIINTLPESLLLKELNYQPLLKKIKAHKAIENHKNQILISGQSNNSIEFSQWISQLEDIKWIQSVEILSFEDHTKSSSTFTIKLNMRDDTED
ncbi:hypothetical protein [uncultured Winogradskyella sp.]|uniref:hypothetical protein n=1 Tax=uncultured Winogradskyella sp. TaxID=395353 RepID=UPI0026148356|nr:hypothetical protein [uncultured Winogradskyella sp.]